MTKVTVYYFYSIPDEARNSEQAIQRIADPLGEVTNEGTESFKSVNTKNPMGAYEKKTREIQRSLNKRSRMRRAYFKMIGEDPKKANFEKKLKSIDREIDLSDVSDSDNEDPSSSEKPAAKRQSPEPVTKKPRGKQLASQKRSERYHQQKDAELQLKLQKKRREQNKKVMQKRTPRGQPRLGAQMGVLLDKIKKNQS